MISRKYTKFDADWNPYRLIFGARKNTRPHSLSLHQNIFKILIYSAKCSEGVSFTFEETIQ